MSTLNLTIYEFPAEENGRANNSSSIMPKLCYQGIEYGPDKIRYQIYDQILCSNDTIIPENHKIYGRKHFYFKTIFKSKCNIELYKCTKLDTIEDPILAYHQSKKPVRLYEIEEISDLDVSSNRINYRKKRSNPTDASTDGDIQLSNSNQDTLNFFLEIGPEHYAEPIIAKSWSAWSDCSTYCIPRDDQNNPQQKSIYHPKSFRNKNANTFFFGVQTTQQERDYYLENPDDCESIELEEVREQYHLYRQYLNETVSTYNMPDCVIVKSYDLVEYGDCNYVHPTICSKVENIKDNIKNLSLLSIMKCRAEIMKDKVKLPIIPSNYTNEELEEMGLLSLVNSTAAEAGNTFIWPPTISGQFSTLNCTYGTATRFCNTDESPDWDSHIDYSQCSSINETEFLTYLVEQFSSFSEVLEDHTVVPETPKDIVVISTFMDIFFSFNSDLPRKIMDRNFINLEFGDDWDKSKIPGPGKQVGERKKKRQDSTIKRRRRSDGSIEQITTLPTERFHKRSRRNITDANEPFNFDDFIYVIKQIEIILENDQIWQKFSDRSLKIQTGDKIFSLIKNFALYLFYVDENRNLTNFEYRSTIFPDTRYEMVDSNIVQLDYFISDREDDCYELNIKMDFSKLPSLIQDLNLVFNNTHFTLSSCSKSEYFYITQNYILFYNGNSINQQYKKSPNTFTCASWNTKFWQLENFLEYDQKLKTVHEVEIATLGYDRFSSPAFFSKDYCQLHNQNSMVSWLKDQDDSYLSASKDYQDNSTGDHLKIRWSVVKYADAPNPLVFDLKSVLHYLSKKYDDFIGTFDNIDNYYCVCKGYAELVFLISEGDGDEGKTYFLGVV